MESDSRIPQKVAALADALEAVRRHIGFGSVLDLSLYSWLKATAPDAMPWDGDAEEAHDEILAAAAEFVDAVDTAERMLNAPQVSDLELLSASIGGVPWDMRTRRTLKAIQDEISILSLHSKNPQLLFSLLRAKGKAGFEKLQMELSKFKDELRERILDLQSLPSQTYASGSEKKAPPPEEEDDALKPIDKAKVERNDWLLEMRGKDHRPKMTEADLSNALLKECENKPNWVHIEPRSISAALHEAYERQTGKPWTFDGRGRTKKT